MNAAVFHPTCEKVQRLVERQLAMFTDSKRTQAVLLVGGFGESNYLYEKLVARFGKMVLKGDNAFVPLPLIYSPAPDADTPPPAGPRSAVAQQCGASSDAGAATAARRSR